MISYSDIQNAYNRVYAAMRKYIWDFSVVEALADLEIAAYKTFPNLSEVRSRFYRLRGMVSYLFPEDKEMKKRFDSLGDILEEDVTFSKINQVNEVIQQ